MKAHSDDDAPKEETDVLAHPEEAHRFRRLYHMASGASILGIDWLLFSGNALSAGMATLPTMLLGFTLGGVSTALIQRFVAGDSTPKSLAKALLAGLIVGTPTPVAGSALGGVIMAVSGLSRFQLRSRTSKSKS